MSIYSIFFISEIDLIPLVLTFISSLCIGIEVNIIFSISQEFFLNSYFYEIFHKFKSIGYFSYKI